MRIAIDISPLSTGNHLQHRVRGVGFYITNLKKAFLKYFPDNFYTFFIASDTLPKNTQVVHYPYFEPFFITLPWKNKYKTVITVHDLIPFVFPKNFPPGIRGKIKWQIQKWFLKKADAIITDSYSSKKDIEKFTKIKAHKIDVVYLAAGEEFKKINNKQVLLRTKQKYQLPSQFALYVGDITWNKNLPQLIRAIKTIHIPLVIVGKTITETSFNATNPWNKDLVEVYELLKNDDNIMKLGFISTEDLVAIYNLATVFVMPSLYEGFGLPVLEAMSCGCPVITTKEGSLSEVAENAAFYVDPYSTHSIASGIRTVFENKDLQRELSIKGLQQVRKFSWEKTAKNTVKVYEKII